MPNNLTIALGTGSTADTATLDVSGIHHQIHFKGQRSLAHTFTTTGNGTTVDASAHGVQSFGLQVKGTGAAPTSWTVVLEGSMNNTNFTTILTHVNTASADGSIVWSGAAMTPCLYFRARCAALSLGSATNIVATVVGM